MRITRRQLIKASLIGAGGLVAATGFLCLERLATTRPIRGRWRRLRPKTAPGPRAYAALAYDAARRKTVLFGGDTGTTKTGDTWTWDGFTWTQESLSLSPPRRSHASFAYHPLTETLVLFGGVGGEKTTPELLGDT